MLSPLRRTLNKLAGKVQRHFVKRGRVATLLRSVPANAVILEIGGSFNPRYMRASHRNVHHLDHASADELRAKYAADPAVAHRIGNIQPVDFVFDGRPIETLIPAGLRFDLIYGSHSLEHQVDLVGHLQSLARLLKPGGRVIELIPDLRACFDALRFPTVTADALLAHQRQTPVHQGKQVFDAMSREIVTNHGFRICDADLDGATFRHTLTQAQAAMLAAAQPGAAYVDTHAWTFTPESFELLLIELRLLRLIELMPNWVSRPYGNQFFALLEPCATPLAALSPEAVQALEQRRLQLARRLRVR